VSTTYNRRQVCDGTGAGTAHGVAHITQDTPYLRLELEKIFLFTITCRRASRPYVETANSYARLKSLGKIHA
jgi:hypothetical protein